jgi:hypothetical protein
MSTGTEVNNAPVSSINPHAMIKPMKIFAFLLLTSAEAAFAQEGDPESKKRHTDSAKNVYMTEAAIRNPLLRQFSLSTDVIAPADMKSQYNGSPLLDGRIRQVRTSALINIPVTSWAKTVYPLRPLLFNNISV